MTPTFALSVWVIYDRPSDRPEHVIARRHAVDARESQPTDDVITGTTVEAVREQLPPGLCRFPRDPDDEPQIVEVWL